MLTFVGLNTQEADASSGSSISHVDRKYIYGVTFNTRWQCKNWFSEDKVIAFVRQFLDKN
jgi:hypothetical protein